MHRQSHISTPPTKKYLLMWIVGELQNPEFKEGLVWKSAWICGTQVSKIWCSPAPGYGAGKEKDNGRELLPGNWSSPSPGSIKPDRCTDAELSTPGALLDFMKDTEQNLLRFAFCISRVLKCLWSQICLYFLLQFLLILLNLKSPSHTLLTIHQRFDKYSLSFSSQFLMDYFL